jgi:hypothetical protein
MFLNSKFNFFLLNLFTISSESSEIVPIEFKTHVLEIYADDQHQIMLILSLISKVIGSFDNSISLEYSKICVDILGIF